MGEANNRGTPEERRSMAVARQEMFRREKELFDLEHPPKPAKPMSMLPVMYGLTMMQKNLWDKYFKV